MTVPFLIERRRFRPGRVHLLPTASVVIVARAARTRVVLHTPHKAVRVLDDVVECARLSPNLVKCLLGEPRRFLELELAPTAHPMLAPFAECSSLDDVSVLLGDLRRSLTITPDERDFLALWRAHVAGEEPIPTGDRWIQRLCMRFAGQSPKRIDTLARLARTLEADDRSGLYNSLGAFADASHFGRVCRAHTGKTPTGWRNMSQTFY